jgi:hypothetical protein
MVGLSKSPEQFHPYFIVGKPSDPSLAAAYKRAVEFIGEAPLSPTIVSEDDVETFVNEIADKVLAHDRK